MLCNPQTLVAGSIGVVIYYLVKRVGGDVAQYLDQYGQDILDSFSAGRNEAIRNLEQSVQQEEALEGMLECRKEAFDVLRVRGGEVRVRDDGWGGEGEGWGGEGEVQVDEWAKWGSKRWKNCVVDANCQSK